MRDSLTLKFDLKLDAVQLKLAAGLVFVGAAFVAWGWSNRLEYFNSPTIDPARVAEAREFIDPNTAAYASLRRLPGVGDVRARAIIDYRENCENPPAFQEPEDLLNVQGIGNGTLRESLPLIKIQSGK